MLAYKGVELQGCILAWTSTPIYSFGGEYLYTLHTLIVKG